MNESVSKLFSTWFYLGLFPYAPGTIGTLGAIPLYFLLLLLPTGVYGLFLVLFFFFAVKVSADAQSIFHKEDPGEVVIDEVAGFLVTMFLVPPSNIGLVLGVVLFRLFDIVKPPPCRRLEALPRGYGIVVDDIAAGVYANICLQVITRTVL